MTERPNKSMDRPGRGAGSGGLRSTLIGALSTPVISAVGLNRIAIVVTWIVGMVAALLVGLALYLFFGSGPPKEAALLHTFYTHRSSFEQLRDMLQADEGLRRVATWGVETKEGTFSPAAGHFPADRYARYLALLKDAHSRLAYRGDGAHPVVGINLWASGFGGDTVHIDICWSDDPPSRQVSSFDSYYRDHQSSGTNGWVCRHIDGKWYVATDLWSK